MELADFRLVVHSRARGLSVKVQVASRTTYETIGVLGIDRRRFAVLERILLGGTRLIPGVRLTIEWEQKRG